MYLIYCTCYVACTHKYYMYVLRPPTNFTWKTILHAVEMHEKSLQKTSGFVAPPNIVLTGPCSSPNHLCNFATQASTSSSPLASRCAHKRQQGGEGCVGKGHIFCDADLLAYRTRSRSRMRRTCRSRSSLCLSPFPPPLPKLTTTQPY